MSRFAFCYRHDEKSKNIALKIQTELLKKDWIFDEECPEFVFCIGGDGTFLTAVHRYLALVDDILFIGVHTGTLGFMTDYQADQVDELIHDVLTLKPHVDEHRLLQVHFDDQDYYAFNEMRIENAIKTQILDIKINDVFLETFRGTGICLATQMGSTAYNRSNHGAVISFGLPLLELSEIAGIHHREYQSLKNPLILKEDVRVCFESNSFEGAILCYDHKYIALEKTKKIECFNSHKKVRIARYHEYHYLNRLKNLF